MPSPFQSKESHKIGESGETITHDNSMSNGIADEGNIHDGRTSFTVMHRDQDALCERLAILQPIQDVSTTTTTTYNQKYILTFVDFLLHFMCSRPSTINRVASLHLSMDLLVYALFHLSTMRVMQLKL